MTGIVVLPLLIISIGIIIALFIRAFKSNESGLKFMLLGIHITLIGGIVAVDPESNLGGFEYLIVLIGLVISFIGLSKNSEN